MDSMKTKNLPQISNIWLKQLECPYITDIESVYNCPKVGKTHKALQYYIFFVVHFSSLQTHSVTGPILLWSKGKVLCENWIFQVLQIRLRWQVTQIYSSIIGLFYKYGLLVNNFPTKQIHLILYLLNGLSVQLSVSSTVIMKIHLSRLILSIDLYGTKNNICPYYYQSIIREVHIFKSCSNNF